MTHMDHDFSVCPVATDGKHSPSPATVHDREMPAGYLTIECALCGQTTGYPMPEPEEVTWD